MVDIHQPFEHRRQSQSLTVIIIISGGQAIPNFKPLAKLPIMDNVERVSIAGRELRCQHCGQNEFRHETATLDRLMLGGFFHAEGWAGHRLEFYVCIHCGFAHFFFPVAKAAPQRRQFVPEQPCLSCGAPILETEDQCPECGWTYATESADES